MKMKEEASNFFKEIDLNKPNIVLGKANAILAFTQLYQFAYESDIINNEYIINCTKLIIIIIGIIILGFIMKRIELSDIIKRVEFTNSYRHKFIELINGIMSRNCFNQQLYYELTSDVKSMQYELGSDGIFAYVTDNLRGFSTSNYQLLVNFLPELRNAINERDNGIIMNRINQSAQDCDDRDCFKFCVNVKN